MVKREQEQYIVSVKINIVEKYFHWWPYFCYRPLRITKRIMIDESDRNKYKLYTFIYIIICSTRN